MTLQKNSTLIFCLALIFTNAIADTPNLRMSCQEKRDETKAIHLLAKGVIFRKNEHTLEIKLASKTMMFVDTPPYDETENDNQYYFCDRKEGFILISNNDTSFFTGLLINENTGQVIPGGLEVIFSNDKHAYYIQEQPDGMDGQLWKIYTVKGKLSWSGYSYIPRNGDWNFASAYLDRPAWKENGEFTATAECFTSIDNNKPTPPTKKWAVTLKKINGEWGWFPKKQCAQNQ